MAPVTVTFGVVAFVALVALLVAGLGEYAWAPLAVAALAIGMSVFTALVAVRKERYTLTPTGIVAASGGLFSDRQADLELRNVTHVKQRLPWIRYRLFGVGDVIVDSAGSSGNAVVLRCVRDPDAVTAQIRERLRGNGFSLQGRTVLHEDTPDPVGVAVETLGLAVGVVFGAIVALASIILDTAGGFDGALRALERGTGALPGWLGLAVFTGLPMLLVGSGFVALVLRYLDMRRRTYTVYDDEVVYREGFLDRTNAFMPFENIADADEVKTLVDQVLGLSDVTVSCQGSGQEVKFRRLRRGPEMKAAIAQLVAVSNARANERAAARSAESARPDARPKVMPEGPRLLAPDQAWTATLQPVPLRAIAPLFTLLPLVPVWLFATVASWIGASVTRYTIGPTSIGLRQGILQVTEREYAYDKVTGALVKSTPFDRLFNTVTIQVWSIGSTTPLDIAHVPRDAVDLPRLLRNLGIEQTPAARTLETTFGVGVWLRSALPGFVILGLLFAALAIGPPLATGEPLAAAGAGLVPIVVVAAYVWRQLWIEKQRCTLHSSHVELQHGVWWRHHIYARYDDTKKVAIKLYPGGGVGDVQIFVAGERIVQQGNNNGAVPVPYSLTARFVPATHDLGAQLDEVLQGVRDPGDDRPVGAVAPVLEARPKVAQMMVGALFVALLLAPFSPFILIVSWMRARRVRYRLEADRIVRSEGLLYRRETSMLLERIDSLEQKQGAFGKLFGTGTVTLFTAGSSRPDLALGALPDHGTMYRAIRERYGG